MTPFILLSERRRSEWAFPRAARFRANDIFSRGGQSLVVSEDNSEEKPLRYALVYSEAL